MLTRCSIVALKKKKKKKKKKRLKTKRVHVQRYFACIQDTLSSRARLAFRPSASREQRYLAYKYFACIQDDVSREEHIVDQTYMI